jgi:hypothetical protein
LFMVFAITMDKTRRLTLMHGTIKNFCSTAAALEF